MPKLSSLGNSGFGRIPANWHDNASQETLFQNWPEVPGTDDTYLEPYGNPAYEGYGYPAAGYGQTRRKVVGLALPKVPSPQLSSNGWSGKVPQGTIIRPMGTLNAKSDVFSRAEVSVLQGLGQVAQEPPPSQELQDKRRVLAWKIVAEMDSLYEQAKKAKPSEVVAWARTQAGLDAPLTALNSLLKNYYSVWRPRLLGQDNINEKLDAAVKAPNRNWLAWVDAANSLSSQFRDAIGDVKTYSLANLIGQATAQTVGQIVGGVAEVGKRTLTIADWLTKPIVFVPVGLGLLAIYLYGRGRGAASGYNMPMPMPQEPKP